jgi:Undecaprenyl-phosphate galactose phosphotransferase WbaP
MPNAGSGRIRAVFNDYAGYYRRVLIIPDLFGMRSLSVSAKDICGILVLDLDQKLTLFIPQFVKRCFDVIASTGVALLASPVLLALCVAVRLSSPGPIFYGQSRIGRNQKSFKVWKFRSMVVNADAVLKARLDADPALREEWERDHKLKRDPRVTWIGRFLRKSSLDELPQIWNVICGEMSLVGPRPITHAEIERYGDIFGQYLRVIPGVTGLWQISGRNNTTYELRTRIDDYYVRNWSLSLDIYILFRTFKTIVWAEGAY